MVHKWRHIVVVKFCILPLSFRVLVLSSQNHRSPLHKLVVYLWTTHNWKPENGSKQFSNSTFLLSLEDFTQKLLWVKIQLQRWERFRPPIEPILLSSRSSWYCWFTVFLEEAEKWKHCFSKFYYCRHKIIDLLTLSQWTNLEKNINLGSLLTNSEILKRKHKKWYEHKTEPLI